MKIEHQKLLEEIEMLFRMRTPARTVSDASPDDRVNRSEMNRAAHRLGIEYPLGDDDFDRAVFKMFDRFRKEFPDEKWEPRKNWTAATKRRRKELGLN